MTSPFAPEEKLTTKFLRKCQEEEEIRKEIARVETEIKLRNDIQSKREEIERERETLDRKYEVLRIMRDDEDSTD
jgi:uncharacterized protein HemY